MMNRAKPWLISFVTIALLFSFGASREGFYSNSMVLSTGSTTRRDVTTRFGEIKNVKDFGATGDGTTNDAAAIQAAITAAQLTGATVFFPQATGYKITTGLTVPAAGAKPIKLAAANPYGAIIKGTNITLLTIAKTGTIVEDLGFQDTNASGSASFIGIDVNNGASGIANWSLRGVRVIGQNNIEDIGMGTLVTLGKGVNLNFALKGAIENCVIAGFNVGISTNALSNSNNIAGTKVRICTKGIDIPSGGADNVFVGLATTIEGCSIGINCDAACLLTCVGSHFENNLGSKVNIQMSVGWLVTMGNGFFAANANKDVFITGGAYKIQMRGDEINSGVTHNGSGAFTIEKASFGSTTAGTGTVTVN